MAIDYHGQLARYEIEAGIAPTLQQKELAVWVDAIDTMHMRVHNETPVCQFQFTWKDKKKKICAGTRNDSSKLTELNTVRLKQYPQLLTNSIKKIST